MHKLPTRKNMRLKDYDYSQNGAYFVTTCVKAKHEILWAPVGARIARPHSTSNLSNIGRIIETAILSIPEIYPNIILDKYVIMPNHIHMILLIDNGRAMRAPTPISTVINQFKGYATKQIGYSIWQKLYHDHIIRSEDDYQKIWQYIDENPVKWTEDCYFSL